LMAATTPPLLLSRLQLNLGVRQPRRHIMTHSLRRPGLAVVVLLLACGHEPRNSPHARADSAKASIGAPPSTTIQPFDTTDLVVAGLRQGMDSAAVARLLGPPDSISAEPDGRDARTKLVEWHYPAVSISLGSNGKLGGVSITSGAVATKRGLRLGDSRARLVSLYGLPADTTGQAWQYETVDGLYVMQIDFLAGVVRRVYLGHFYD